MPHYEGESLAKLIEALKARKQGLASPTPPASSTPLPSGQVRPQTYEEKLLAEKQKQKR